MRCNIVKKTVCELFAGVGGFRCGLNNIKTLDDFEKKEKWDTVWFRSHQKRLHSMRMIVMCIILEKD